MLLFLLLKLGGGVRKMAAEKTMMAEFMDAVSSISSNFNEFQKKQGEIIKNFQDKAKNFPLDFKADEINSSEDKIVTGAMLLMTGLASATSDGIASINSMFGITTPEKKGEEGQDPSTEKEEVCSIDGVCSS